MKKLYLWYQEWSRYFIFVFYWKSEDTVFLLRSVFSKGDQLPFLRTLGFGCSPMRLKTPLHLHAAACSFGKGWETSSSHWTLPRRLALRLVLVSEYRATRGLQISWHILSFLPPPALNFPPGLMDGRNESSFSNSLAAKGLPTWWTLAGQRGFSRASQLSSFCVLASSPGCWLRTNTKFIPPVEKHLACFPKTANASLLTCTALIEC